MNSLRWVASRLLLALAIFVLLTGARSRPVRPVAELLRLAPIDEHSYANGAEVSVRHVKLDLTVDFQQRRLHGNATLEIENLAGASELILDTRGLEIEQVTLDDGSTARHSLGVLDPILGRPLVVPIAPATREVRVVYSTSPQADGLHWMTPAQAGQSTPYLYSQNEPIDARSWIPIHDSPQLRMTWEATIRVPAEYLAVMSAGGNPREKSADGVYHFSMPQRVPAYLIALAVADLEFREIDARSGVYAAPDVVEAAARELAIVPAMMTAAEMIAGPHRWERYDLAIMPPSYHIGGMEHARLNFVNPSFISGDGSLVSLIAHELGHSWSGNLVTTANWDGVWLNEGLTVWLERRIMEELFGRDYEEMLAANGATNLHAHVDAVTASGGSTSLHQDFGGRDPNEGFSTLAYEKGYSFMRTLEERVGRAEFDLFIKAFFSRHQFRWIDAAGFLASLRAGPLAGKPGLETELRLEEWIFESGIPANAGDVSSTRFAAVDRELAAFHSGAAPSSLRTSGWSPHEFAYFLRNARDSIIATRMGTLESTFGFDATRNLSLLFRWSLRSAMHRYAPSFDAMERYLMSVGSGSGLYAIYATLLNTGERPRALDIYSRARPRYHPYSQWSIDALFNPPARLSGAPRALPPTKY